MRETRLAMGLSCRAMAARLGLSFATVAALERGREPRWSTLMRLAQSGVEPSRLLRGGALRPAPVTRRLFDFLAQAHALRARRVTISLARERRATSMVVTVEGLVAVRTEGSTESVVRALVRLACIAPNAFLRSLAPPGQGTVESTDELGVGHEITVTPTPQGPSVSYRRRCQWTTPEQLEALAVPAAPRWDGRMLSYSVAYPIEELTLAWKGPGAPAPDTASLRVGTVLRDESVDLSAALHPGSRRRLRTTQRGGTEASILHALPGLDYALCAGEPAARAEPAVRRTPPKSFAPLARAARRREGLSQRALAALMHVSHVTVLEAERGRDVRASVLRRYLDAIPRLSADDILPSARGHATSFEEVWNHQRTTLGVEVDEYLRHHVLTPEGASERTERIVGLRSLSRTEDTLRVLLGSPRSPLMAGDRILQRIVAEVAADAAVLKTRIVDRKAGRSNYQLVVPGRLSRRGVTITHHFHVDLNFAMTAARARVRHGAEGPFVAGMSAMSSLPCRRLTLDVAFPPGTTPKVAWCVAWSALRVPDETGTIVDGVQAASHAFELGPRRAALVVEQPLVGLAYGMGWLLP